VLQFEHAPGDDPNLKRFRAALDQLYGGRVENRSLKPEAADYLGKARQCLDDAKQIAAATQLHRILVREAYLAVYHTFAEGPSHRVFASMISLFSMIIPAQAGI